MVPEVRIELTTFALRITSLFIKLLIYKQLITPTSNFVSFCGIIYLPCGTGYDTNSSQRHTDETTKSQTKNKPALGGLKVLLHNILIVVELYEYHVKIRFVVINIINEAFLRRIPTSLAT